MAYNVCSDPAGDSISSPTPARKGRHLCVRMRALRRVAALLFRLHPHPVHPVHRCCSFPCSATCSLAGASRIFHRLRNRLQHEGGGSPWSAARSRPTWASPRRCSRRSTTRAAASRGRRHAADESRAPTRRPRLLVGVPADRRAAPAGQHCLSVLSFRWPGVPGACALKHPPLWRHPAWNITITATLMARPPGPPSRAAMGPRTTRPWTTRPPIRRPSTRRPCATHLGHAGDDHGDHGAGHAPRTTRRPRRRAHRHAATSNSSAGGSGSRWSSRSPCSCTARCPDLPAHDARLPGSA